MCKALAISASNCSPLVLKNKRMFAFMRGIPAGGFRWAAQFALLRACGQAKPRPAAEIPYGCAANPLISGWLYTLVERVCALPPAHPLAPWLLSCCSRFKRQQLAGVLIVIGNWCPTFPQ